MTGHELPDYDNLPATTRIKIAKARDTWHEVYGLGYFNRVDALRKQLDTLKQLLGITHEELVALLTRKHG